MQRRLARDLGSGKRRRNVNYNEDDAYLNMLDGSDSDEVAPEDGKVYHAITHPNTPQKVSELTSTSKFRLRR